MKRVKKILKSWRIWILIISLLFSYITISPDFGAQGVAIRNVLPNSSASRAGIQSPSADVRPMARERIISLDNRPIENEQDYHNFIESIRPNESIQVKTDKGLYRIRTGQNVTTTEDLGLRVHDAPNTNIRKGLDLQGGTRVLLQPEEEVSPQYMSDLILSMEQRLNVFGLSDVTVRDATDLSGNQYIVVEIAGVNEEEVKELLSKQGKFEAKIGNTTVFRGGNDITYVCRTADCSGIDPTRGCQQASETQWFCSFSFSISLSPEAAQRQANATRDLQIVGNPAQQQNSYLSEQLVLYLDDQEVDRLNIGATLKGQQVTSVQISGSGSGISQQDAIDNTLEQMRKLQTILITGSLPVKLNIVKTDNISPLLGEEFIENALLVGLVAIISVGLFIFLRYRSLKISIPLMITSLSEVGILLGVAALIGWNIDLAAIAGIIIAVGTGVDHQVVITDETLKKDDEEVLSWKKKIKRAFFIITASYLTVIVAMVPLLFAGAGLLKGFAIITMIGFSVGVFITRPAFASIIEILLEE